MNFEGNYPISFHDSWNILDSTKLSAFAECPRMFFYNYLLGWDSETKSQDLVFGEAWHCAMEHLLLNGYGDVQGAYEKFTECYRKDFDPSTDELFQKKNPESALIALAEYSGYYSADLRQNELLYTEISGSVPISEKDSLHFRMDSVLKDSQGRIFSWDHKTTGINFSGFFGKKWEDEFFLSIQNGTYTHCLYCLYDPSLVRGVEFNGVSFQYTKRGGPKIDFRRIPAWKSPEQMNIWLWNTCDLVSMLKFEMERLQACKSDDPVMMAFPIRPGRCTKYRGCPYHNFCMSWPNPLRKCEEPPLGFATRFWDPREIETTNKMNLEGINF